MKERIFTLLLAMIMLMPAMAQEVVDPGWSLNEETGELRIWKDFEDFELSSEDAWRSSKDLIKSVVIEDGVTKIAAGSFYDCKSLTSVEIPNSVTSIGDYAFRNCSGLTSVEIPNGVTCIWKHAFDGCSGLTSVEIPNSVTRIGSYAFAGCSGLTSLEIPNSVTRIESFAFHGCSGLTSVEIPNSVTRIESYAFAGCSNLKTVYTDKENPTIFRSIFETSKTYIVPCIFSDELLAKYTDARLTVKKEWHNFTNYVYNGDASLEADGTETAECDRDGCEVTDTRTAEGTKHAGTPTSVKKIDAGHSHKARKVVVNGRLMIEKDGEMYDLAGQKM